MILNRLFSSTFCKNGSCASLGDNAGLLPSATAGSVWVSLHTSDPGEAGNQTTNESAYTNYARVAVARSAASWAVAASTGFNIGALSFPTCGATSSAVTYAAIGSASTGAGRIFLSGSLASTLNISAGITPSFAASQLTCYLD